MRRRVIFHGYLRDLIPEPIVMMAPTLGHVLEALSRAVPALATNGIRGRHRVAIAGCNSEADIHTPWKGEDIHIFPQVNGGAKNGIVQIVVGALLIAAAFALPATAPAWLFNGLFAMGASLALGGLIALLSPAPKIDNNKSRYLGSPKNTVAIGTKIPILYGKFRTYGHYLSFSIVARLKDKNDKNT